MIGVEHIALGDAFRPPSPLPTRGSEGTPLRHRQNLAEPGTSLPPSWGRAGVGGHPGRADHATGGRA
jgi:hypothetical protein